jgi:nitrogen PTS system EIIA component
MRLTEILTEARIIIDPEGRFAPTKEAALGMLAEVIARDLSLRPEEVFTPLVEREKLQSTGIGEGVAIPHSSLAQIERQTAALLLSPQGIPFDAIDHAPAQIIFAVISPKRAASEHLKILAKISRLLRSPETRRRLLESRTSEQAFALVSEHDDRNSLP